jgi:LysM repeat protein
MKQKEKFLVYAVTGFLVVILMIAVIFGKEGPRRGADNTGAPTPRNLAAVLDGNKGEPAKEGDKDGKSTDGPGAADHGKTDDSTNRSGLPAAGSVLPERPLVVPAPSATPPATLADRLGPSRIEGFGDQRVRYVRVRSGDTLGALVQRWCGSDEIHLATAKALNEELTVLKAGTEIALPFVADEVVLAAFQARQAASQPESAPGTKSSVDASGNANSAVPTEAPASKPDFKEPGASLGAGAKESPVVPANVRIHEVKAGEMLWKLAVKEVGDKQAPKFIAVVKELNPEVSDFDRLKVGQKLKFPAK